ncbi:hypothetical protein GGS21DRAFT_499899 [Xylaria nigripes]|nr:hypothetical protein GGS21DRAFT_499899 [Xylaria nigripes]
MAASRRGQPELRVQLPPSQSVVALPDLPAISALFLIDFDVKAGYTILWQASKPGVELEGVVEYKSLPSGLHTVSEDLIYFVHGEYAGLSAFINVPVDDTAARNARMLAVGVLVPLSYGRLGRSWKHAESLKAMASKLAIDSKDVGTLQEYWEKNQVHDHTEDDAVAKEDNRTPTTARKPRTPKDPTRKRSVSDGAALMLPGHRLSPFHPAWSLTKLLDTFGPLIFPIHRAALLRKRILISGHAPVEEACNFVYNISVLSNIPLAISDLLSSSSASHRLRPLFSIGVHDIPFLASLGQSGTTEASSDGQLEAKTGWIACTTDSILSNKDTLWDMLITMPPAHAVDAKKHVWPTVELSHRVPVRATQRDMRRFRSLKAGLTRMGEEPTIPPPGTPQTSTVYTEDDILLDDAEQLVEPTSWTALAYSGFMWWASAGEKPRSDEVEEASQDAMLLSDPSSSSMMTTPRTADLSASITSLTPRRLSAVVSASLDLDEAHVELAMIAYFHRLTIQLLTALADTIDSMNSSDAEEEDESPSEEDALIDASEDDAQGHGVRIDTDVMKRMGLDIWSPADAEFVREFLETYFGREASVEGKGFELCGIKVC